MLTIKRYAHQRVMVMPSDSVTTIEVLGNQFNKPVVLGFTGDAVVKREELVDFDIENTSRQDAIVRLLAVLGNHTDSLDELERREVDYVRERFLTHRSC